MGLLSGSGSMPDENTVIVQVEVENENLLVAVQVARKHQSRAWKELLRDHRNHPSFRTVQDVMKREIGFACSCTGETQEYRITLTRLVDILPDVRTSIARTFSNLQSKGNKARKRKQLKVRMRAKALLYRYLTKEQKWSLRASKSFSFTGKDGHTYEIREFSCNNVTRYENDKPLYQFCVVSNTTIPVYDLMLGQKLMLETDPRAFLDIAVTKHIPSGEIWDSGKHIDNPDVEPPLSYEQKQALWQRAREAEDGPRYVHPNEDYEREQYEDIQRRRTSTLGELFVHDICVNAEARYNALLEGLAFVLNSDQEVVPSFDIPFTVPPIENSDQDACIIKLITGVPAEVYSMLAHVQVHFQTYDLCGIHVLVNPETDVEWSRRDPPVWNRNDTVLGVRKILDDRVPKGRAWYVADAETVGMVAHWYNEPKIGYALFNLNGIAIYEPDYAQEEIVQETSSEEARQESGQAGPKDQEASSEEGSQEGQAGIEEASSEGYQEGEG